MTSAKITSKGQITIPKTIRDYLKIDAGSKIDFVIDADGQVKLLPLNIPAKTLSGILRLPERKPATIEEMEQATVEGVSDWT